MSELQQKTWTAVYAAQLPEANTPDTLIAVCDDLEDAERFIAGPFMRNPHGYFNCYTVSIAVVPGDTLVIPMYRPQKSKEGILDGEQ